MRGGIKAGRTLEVGNRAGLSFFFFVIACVRSTGKVAASGRPERKKNGVERGNIKKGEWPSPFCRKRAIRRRPKETNSQTWTLKKGNGDVGVLGVVINGCGIRGGLG